MIPPSQSSGSESPATRDLRARLARLADDAEQLGGGREQRRENLVERAESRGLGRVQAEQAYDMALEVGLEPAYAMALVMEGISIRPLGGPAADVDASEPVEPEWVDAPPSPEEAAHERRLRQTFRRLRSLIEREASAEAAFRALAREPDLEAYQY